MHTLLLLKKRLKADPKKRLLTDELFPKTGRSNISVIGDEQQHALLSLIAGGKFLQHFGEIFIVVETHILVF